MDQSKQTFDFFFFLNDLYQEYIKYNTSNDTVEKRVSDYYDINQSSWIKDSNDQQKITEFQNKNGDYGLHIKQQYVNFNNFVEKFFIDNEKISMDAFKDYHKFSCFSFVQFSNAELFEWMVYFAIIQCNINFLKKLQQYIQNVCVDNETTKFFFQHFKFQNKNIMMVVLCHLVFSQTNQKNDAVNEIWQFKDIFFAKNILRQYFYDIEKIKDKNMFNKELLCFQTLFDWNEDQNIINDDFKNFISSFNDLFFDSFRYYLSDFVDDIQKYFEQFDLFNKVCNFLKINKNDRLSSLNVQIADYIVFKNSIDEKDNEELILQLQKQQIQKNSQLNTIKQNLCLSTMLLTDNTLQQALPDETFFYKSLQIQSVRQKIIQIVDKNKILFPAENKAADTVNFLKFNFDQRIALDETILYDFFSQFYEINQKSTL